MSPTVFREGGYRFFFFSREEPRMHVHAICGDGEAKYWLKPDIDRTSPVLPWSDLTRLGDPAGLITTEQPPRSGSPRTTVCHAPN